MQVASEHQSKMEEKRKKIAISRQKCNQKRRNSSESMQVAWDHQSKEEENKKKIVIGK